MALILRTASQRLSRALQLAARAVSADHGPLTPAGPTGSLRQKHEARNAGRRADGVSGAAAAGKFDFRRIFITDADSGSEAVADLGKAVALGRHERAPQKHGTYEPQVRKEVINIHSALISIKNSIVGKDSAMLHTLHRQTAEAPKADHPVAVAGRQWVRYALVAVIAWIGALKYSSYEAAAIHPLIANSPIMSWFYNILGVRALSATLGTVEIIAALLIALRFVSPRLSAVGSAIGIVLFLGTLSFLFTTPGVTAAGGFPVLSVLPGQFLLKDLVLLGAALWTLGDSLGAIRSRTRSAVPGQRSSSP